MTPLRQRFIEDLRVRNYAPRTIEAYVAGVLRLARYLGRAPDQASAEVLRSFQVALVDRGVSWSVRLLEFLRRFLQHGPPNGFVKIRHGGLLGNRHRTERLELCRRLLFVAAAREALLPTGGDPRAGGDAVVEPTKPPSCPACGSQRVVYGELEPNLVLPAAMPGEWPGHATPTCPLDSS
jgi:hypothetical protein